MQFLLQYSTHYWTASASRGASPVNRRMLFGVGRTFAGAGPSESWKTGMKRYSIFNWISNFIHVNACNIYSIFILFARNLQHNFNKTSTKLQRNFKETSKKLPLIFKTWLAIQLLTCLFCSPGNYKIDKPSQPKVDLYIPWKTCL